MHDQSPLSTGQVAEHCRVDPRTVLRWIKRGQLPAFQLPGRGDHRVEVADLLVFLRTHGMPVPIELADDLHRILVVDDDEPMARAVVRSLRPLEAEMDVALNGFQAGTMIERWRPHLITLDLSMPGIGGMQVLGMLRSDESFRNTRVIVISALAKEHRAQALSLGADEVFEKPFDNAELARAAAGLLRRVALAG